MTFRVGEVRIAEDKDFEAFKNLCVNDSDWRIVYDKKAVQVFTRQTTGATIQMVKVRSVLDNLSPDTLYDVIHDEEYRKEWDKNMIEGFQIAQLNPNNDICYYALRVAPVKARDFVMQRSWLELPNNEFMIFNHSISHKKHMPRKSAVRAISLLTGYNIAPGPSNGKAPTTSITYLSQTDVRGRIPTWVVNKAYQFLAPRIVQRLHKIAQKYPAWKEKHRPEFKPWLFPEQVTAPKLNWDDIDQDANGEIGELVDETNLQDDAAGQEQEEEND